MVNYGLKRRGMERDNAFISKAAEVAAGLFDMNVCSLAPFDQLGAESCAS